MGSDPRIGVQFLFAGLGFGGSCFPKDVSALLHTAGEYHRPLKILDAVEKVNKRQKMVIVDKIKAHFKGDLKGRVITLWGLAFKPNTDDVREAPALSIIAGLRKLGARVRAHDPKAIDEMKRRIGNAITYADNNYDALKGADALVIVTEWSDFRRPDFDRMKGLMRTPVVFDGRNIYNPAIMREKGFVYYGIGRNGEPHTAKRKGR
jgi:UDPglucose 6-dehydrogenase